LAQAFHGKKWEKKIGNKGRVGMMLLSRAAIELHAFIEAHKK
jgi:hypothetical protein